MDIQVPLATALIIGVLSLSYYVKHRLDQEKTKRKKAQENLIEEIKKESLEQLRERVSALFFNNAPAKLDEMLTIITTNTQYTIQNINDSQVHNTGGLIALACRLGRSECLKVLLDHGTNVQSCDGSQETGLHLASRNGNYECMKVLFQYKADPNARNDGGWTPLHWCCANGRSEGTLMLLQAGSDPSARTTSQRIPLHMSAQNGHATDCKYLLEAGCDIHSRDQHNNTPILASGGNGSVQVLQLFLQYGALLSDRNNAGQTPLLRAAEGGLSDFVLAIIEIDPQKYLFELVSVIERFQQQNGDRDVQDRQQKYRSVLQRVLKKEEYKDRILMIFVEKILSLAINFLQNANPDQESATVLNNSVTQFSWMIDFYLKTTPEGDQRSAVHMVSTLDPVWNRLETILTQIDSDGQEITPVIEFQVCTVIGMYYTLCKASQMDRDELCSKFRAFADQHRYVLRTLVRSKPALLLDSLEFILELYDERWDEFGDLRSLLSFDDQRAWLEKKIQTLKSQFVDEQITITIPRDNLLNESCSLLMVGDSSLFKGAFTVQFENERGVGAGVRREWFRVITDELFHPNNALFRKCHDGTLQPTPISEINDDHLSYFRFAGRIIGLAIYHGELIDVHFTRYFYKLMLGRPLTVSDFQSTDPEYFKNLQWILKNPAGELNLTFCDETEELGCFKIVDLIENGREIPVTNENKASYVQLMIEQKMTGAIRTQIEYFLEGFHDIIPQWMVSIFNEYQLELLVAGIPEIDLEDWKQNTTLNGYELDSDQVRWFWEIVAESDQHKRAELLQFVTGSSRVPIGGFANLAGYDSGVLFTILRSNDCSTLPTASTCFNLLKLPAYDSKEIMKQKLDIATSCGSNGFEFS